MTAVNGTEGGMDNGPINGKAAEAESALFEGVEQPQTLDRQAMKDKYTVAKLAEMAKPYSKMAMSTLKGYDKDKLIDIIQSKGEEKKTEEPKARATRSKGEFEQMVDMGIALLDAFKMKRDGEPNPMMLKELVKSQIIMKADEAKQEGTFDQDKASNLVFAGGIIALTVSTIGVDRIMDTGKKLFQKFSKKAEV